MAIWKSKRIFIESSWLIYSALRAFLLLSLHAKCFLASNLVWIYLMWKPRNFSKSHRESMQNYISKLNISSRNLFAIANQMSWKMSVNLYPNEFYYRHWTNDAKRLNINSIIVWRTDANGKIRRILFSKFELRQTLAWASVWIFPGFNSIEMENFVVCYFSSVP